MSCTKYTQTDGDALIARIKLVLCEEGPLSLLGFHRTMKLRKIYQAFQANEETQTDEMFDALRDEVKALEDAIIKRGRGFAINR